MASMHMLKKKAECTEKETVLCLKQETTFHHSNAAPQPEPQLSIFNIYLKLTQEVQALKKGHYFSSLYQDLHRNLKFTHI